MGASDEVIATLEKSGDDDAFEIWSENWEVAEAFLCVSTQWRAIARGMEGAVYYQGLDYAGVGAGLAGAGVAVSPDIWAGLRVMEAAARNMLNGIRSSDE